MPPGGVRWKTPIPVCSHASPVVWDDRVYVVSAVRIEGTSAIDRQAQGVVFAQDTVRHAWKLYALDRASGRIVWERVAMEGAPAARPACSRHVCQCHAGNRWAIDRRDAGI